MILVSVRSRKVTTEHIQRPAVHHGGDNGGHQKRELMGLCFKDPDAPEAYSENQHRDPTEGPLPAKKILSKGHSPTWKLLVWREVIGSKVVRSVTIPPSSVKHEGVAVEKRSHVLVAREEAQSRFQSQRCRRQPASTGTPAGAACIGRASGSTWPSLRVPHTGAKPHPGSTCGKVLRCRSNLADHWRIHTEVKPYEGPECGKVFLSWYIVY